MGEGSAMKHFSVKKRVFLSENPAVPEGHKHRVATPGNPRKIPRTPADPRRDPAEPSERPRRALGETPAEPSERLISSAEPRGGLCPSDGDPLEL